MMPDTKCFFSPQEININDRYATLYENASTVKFTMVFKKERIGTVNL